MAWLVRYPVWLVAVIGVLVMRRRARGLDDCPQRGSPLVPRRPWRARQPPVD